MFRLTTSGLRKLIRAISFVAIMLFILTSCAAPTQSIVTQIPVTPINTPTPTVQPSPTPTIPQVILIADQNDAIGVNDPVRSTLISLTEQDGWSLEEMDLMPTEFDSNVVKVVVVIQPDQAISELSSAYPEIQFIAIGSVDLERRDNLSLVGPNGIRQDQVAFLAGYLSAVLTFDWRIGAISDVPAEVRPIIDNSFANGMKFYCGLCLLSYPPFHTYPMHAFIGSADPAQEWLVGADLMLSNSVDTVFLYAQEVNLSAATLLTENDVVFLGINSPPESLRSNWIATLRMSPELVLESRWDDVLNNDGGWVESIPIVLEDINNELLSEGKQRFFEQILFDVYAGFVEPSVISP
jgi:hypothetical protein